MIDTWKNLLPKEYLGLVIEPILFESNMNPLTNMVKFIGFDLHVRRCFYYRASVSVEDCFDADEFPILKKINYEREIAWRLIQGDWIMVKNFTEQLGQCTKHIMTVPVEIMREMLR